jgi:hypothetical protein
VNDAPDVQHWNNRPNDLFNLVSYMSKEFEVPVSWQIADIDQPVVELIETPVLYLATDKSFTLSAEGVKRLREYIDAGGTLVCVPEGTNAGPALRSMKALAASLFPEGELQPLAADHPAMQSHRKLKGSIAVAAVRTEVRMAMFIVQRDIGRDLQLGISDRSRDAFDLMSNIYVYATGVNPRRPRLQSNYILSRDYPTRAMISAARIKTQGVYDPEPGALSQLKAFLAKSHGIDLRVSERAPAELAAADQPLAFLTVTRSSSLPDGEAAALRKWIESGGTLWIDVAAGNPGAAVRLDALLAQLSLREAQIKPVPDGARIITGEGLEGGHDNRTVSWREFSQAQGARAANAPPEISVAHIGDRPAVFISRQDLASGLAGIDAMEISGYKPASARRLIANGVLELIARGGASKPR